MRVRQALRADLPGIAEIWIDAFATDPFLRWMGGDDDATWPAFGRDWFGFIAGQCFERGHCYVTEPGGAAVTWIPPDLAFVGPDDDGLPCTLVSSNPRNVSFYERCGFAVHAEVTTPDGAATIRPMVRASMPT